MTLHVDQLVLLGLLSAALHWLVARSEIARPFWSRASGWLAKLLACAGCSGFWLGAALSLWVRPIPAVFDPRGIHGAVDLSALETVAQAVVTAILSVFVTPVFEAVLLWGLQASAIVDEVPPDDAGSVPNETAQPEHTTQPERPSRKS